MRHCALVSTVQLRGQIDATNAAQFQTQLAEAVMDQAGGLILIDMSEVESLDSAGLMAFVSTLALAQRLNKQLSLVGVATSVRIVFELTQLDRFFKGWDGDSDRQLLAS